MEYSLLVAAKSMENSDIDFLSNIEIGAFWIGDDSLSPVIIYISDEE